MGLFIPQLLPISWLLYVYTYEIIGPRGTDIRFKSISANQRSALRSSCIRSKQYAETTCCCCLKREKKNARGFYRGQLFPERNTSANTRRANRTREDLECKYGLWVGHSPAKKNLDNLMVFQARCMSITKLGAGLTTEISATPTPLSATPGRTEPMLILVLTFLITNSSTYQLQATRSRLYQSNIWQLRAHFSAFFQLYKIILVTFSESCKESFLKKN